MTTLSLGDARLLVEYSTLPSPGNRIRSAKQLRESGIDLIASKQINATSSIALYKNGYVLYSADNRATVFALPNDASYTYCSSAAFTCYEEAFFEAQPWYLRLVLEGEDRLESNQRLRDANVGTFNYADVSDLHSEEGKVRAEGTAPQKRTCKYTLSDKTAGSGLQDKRVDLLEDFIEKESFHARITKIRSSLTDKQYQAFVLNKVEGITQAEIARRMEISQQAVNKLILTAIRKLQKVLV